MSINKVIDILVASVLFILILTCLFLSFKLSTVKAERDAALARVEMLSESINAQNDAINKLAAETEKDNAKLAKSEKDAKLIEFQYQKNSSEIMATYVAGGCNEAIQWGIQQAIIGKEKEL